ncbi:MAG: hypothetical protein A3J49_18750 [Gallionellales bacterium RIFCSPHIGHO2_02_FULL_57_16]|nr:MAG: hypothetical protein A3J49_18750 [Gallionellales bacterium RIFCSPHIGHO2_02_FULL_57_16]
MIKASLVFDKIPLEANYVASISAIEFLEHMLRQNCLGSSNEFVYPFINLMNEIWRVLSSGGRIYRSHGRFIAHIAKLSAPTNYRDMPHHPLKSAVRDLGRRLSRNGLHHMVWELEAVK